ncbi:MAG: hypothetical protein AB1589_42375, partial [Cyanobacteriota bacterium]
MRTMNEKRHQAYLNLIDVLLRCSNGEEAAILNANQDLIDGGLVQTMLQVAANLKVQGNIGASNRLRNIAVQLLVAIGNYFLQNHNFSQ